MALFNLVDVLPSCSSDWGRRVFYSTSGQPPAAATLMAHLSRSFDRWLLSHWRFFAAISVGSSAGGTSRTSAPLLALSTRSIMFSALWQVPWGSCSLWVTPKSRLTFAQSSRLRGRWFLTHWRYPRRSRPTVS